MTVVPLTPVRPLSAEARAEIDKAAHDLIILLARRRAWEDHLASMKPGKPAK